MLYCAVNRRVLFNDPRGKVWEYNRKQLSDGTDEKNKAFDYDRKEVGSV